MGKRRCDAILSGSNLLDPNGEHCGNLGYYHDGVQGYYCYYHYKIARGYMSPAVSQIGFPLEYRQDGHGNKHLGFVATPSEQGLRSIRRAIRSAKSKLGGDSPSADMLL